MDKEKIRLYEESQQLVVKDNLFLRQSRAQLSVVELKIIIYLISKIKADDTDITKVHINIKDFCKLTNIEPKGNNYAKVRDSIKSLKQKTWTMELDDGNSDLIYSWIDYALIRKNTGDIEIALSQFLKPYLIQLHSNFTRYRFKEILNLKSKHAIKIFELATSYLYKGYFRITLPELRHYLGIDNKYDDWRDFRKSVLEPSIKQINDNTYIQIEYEAIKNGKKVEELEIKVNEAMGYQTSWLDE